MVFLMGGVLYATSWIQGALSTILYGYPVVYYLALLGVFYWCMVRTRENAQDLLAILLIVSTSMIAVFSKQKGIDVSNLPLALLKNIFIAGFTGYLAYFMFPGGTPLAPPPDATETGTYHYGAWRILVKALAILVTLVITIRLNLEQSTIITIVVALIIKDPDPKAGLVYGLRRLLTTYASLIYAIPLMLLTALQANIIGTLGMTIVCSLLMGIAAVRKGASFNAIQLMYSSFVVLIYYGITSTGISGLSSDFTRFMSILAAVVLGFMVLILVHPLPRKS